MLTRMCSLGRYNFIIPSFTTTADAVGDVNCNFMDTHFELNANLDIEWS